MYQALQEKSWLMALRITLQTCVHLVMISSIPHFLGLHMEISPQKTYRDTKSNNTVCWLSFTIHHERGEIFQWLKNIMANMVAQCNYIYYTLHVLFLPVIRGLGLDVVHIS